MADVATLSCARCSKPANLQCPKCVELKLPREDAAFWLRKGVPNFWLYALKGHAMLDAQITDQDEGALKHLTDIKWSRIQKGFRLEFYFHTNPFFENPVLTKTYHMNDEDEFFLESAIGTEIAKLKQIETLIIVSLDSFILNSPQTGAPPKLNLHSGP
ncbi:hypothetical protein ABKV19_008822 [Rosa sericea]